jgi:hypothetical protein
MTEKLSSSWTFFYKTVFPILWISLFGSGTLMLWLVKFDKLHQPPTAMKWEFFFIWLVGSGFILRLALRLKAVTLNGDSLIIENYNQKVTVPLSYINGISESRFINPKTIKLNLYPPCILGEEIVFIPKSGFFNPLSQHPIVRRLNELTNQR